VVRDASYLLKVEIPSILLDAADGSFAARAGRRLRPWFRKLQQRPPPDPKASQEAIHDARRWWMRQRYWAECVAHLFPDPARPVLGRLEDLTEALGRLHDAHAALDRISREPLTPPSELLTVLNEYRARYREEVDEAWNRLHRKKFRKKTDERLSQIRKEAAACDSTS
jgi:CHAD domain-containing protein